jgi:hypothetical protein
MLLENMQPAQHSPVEIPADGIFEQQTPLSTEFQHTGCGKQFGNACSNDWQSGIASAITKTPGKISFGIIHKQTRFMRPGRSGYAIEVFLNTLSVHWINYRFIYKNTKLFFYRFKFS